MTTKTLETNVVSAEMLSQSVKTSTFELKKLFAKASTRVQGQVPQKLSSTATTHGPATQGQPDATTTEVLATPGQPNTTTTQFQTTPGISEATDSTPAARPGKVVVPELNLEDKASLNWFKNLFN